MGSQGNLGSHLPPAMNGIEFINQLFAKSD